MIVFTGKDKEMVGIEHGQTLAKSGLYYKHVMIVNDNSSVISNWSFKLIDDAGVVIYDCNRLIIQAIGQNLGQVFNSRCCCMCEMCLQCNMQQIRPNLEG